MKCFAAACAFLLALACASAAWARGGGGCFLPDTPITTADGGHVPIQDLHPGDRVLAFDEHDHCVPATVVATPTHAREGYLRVRVGRHTLRVTAEHPFYVGHGAFKAVSELHVGDPVALQDGGGLQAQPIAAIESVNEACTVYNLSVDGPHTFFADDVAVHNKGGGGGGGGGGFGGGGGGGGGDGVFLLLWLLCEHPLVGGIVILVIIVAVLISPKNDGHSHGTGPSEDLDFVYTPADYAHKARKTGKLLAFLSTQDNLVDPAALTERARGAFVQLQSCWQSQDYEPMRPLLMPALFAEHLAQIAAMARSNETNIIANLRVDAVDIVQLRYTEKKDQRTFTALITAQARDFYQGSDTGRFIRGDMNIAQFQEFWTFQLQNGAWLLRDIEQSRESTALRRDNFVEFMTDGQLAQIYGDAASAAARAPAIPWLPQEVETKADRIERALNFLRQLEKHWIRDDMLREARATFMAVHLARQTWPLDVQTYDRLFPDAADALAAQMDAAHAAGVSAEYRNLCVRKADLVFIQNKTGQDDDIFTVRITAHAQHIVWRNGRVVRQDADVVPWTEYWSFGRRDGAWKLRSVQPDGEAVVRRENVDEDSGDYLLNWYYTQKRAI